MWVGMGRRREGRVRVEEQEAGKDSLTSHHILTARMTASRSTAP